MNIFLHAISTRVPPYCYRQDYSAEKMASLMAEARVARLVRYLHRQSGIAQRYSVLPDFLPDASPLLFLPTADGRLCEPSTADRNRCYIEAGGPLAVSVASDALAAAGIGPNRVTHVVTVSCTGFYNPGPDFQIVTALGLPETTERYHLGFMGCYAALPALRMARQFCLARPEAVVLVVCLELCSLHLQFRPDPAVLLANTLFADGAAAAVVSACPPSAGFARLVLESFGSGLATNGRQDMAWEIGDHGFNISLSSYVPDVIAANVGEIVRRVVEPSEVDLWAVHPGGRSILDKAEQALGLDPSQLLASREVLHDFGNMSSATILFVLQRLLQAGAAVPQRVCALAFGPGLTIEAALLTLTAQPTTLPANQSDSHDERRTARMVAAASDG